MALTGEIRSFWGKAQPLRTSAVSWHPAVAHSLDGAAVGLQRAPRLMPALQPALLAFLLSLHDIGKYFRPFQAKSEPHWLAVLGKWPGALQGASVFPAQAGMNREVLISGP